MSFNLETTEDNHNNNINKRSPCSVSSNINTIKSPSQQLAEDPNLLYDNKERDDSNDLTSWRQKFINEERNSTLSQFIKIYLCDVRNDTIPANRHW